MKTKKIHIPLPVRTVDEPPPLVVGIVGPPKVGKSTLLHCIVKKFCRQKLTSVHGPVTIVSGLYISFFNFDTFIYCASLLTAYVFSLSVLYIGFVPIKNMYFSL